MAVYPIMPGSPDYGTGSSSQYIPAIYSALLVKKFYPKTIFGNISNTDYEGDIKEMGDTVYIRTRPTVETFRYKKGMVLPIQNPESPHITLKIDQGEGFSFALDRLDEHQSDLKLLNEWGDDAAEQMKQVIDRNVLISLAAAGAVAGGGAAASVVGYNAAFNNTGVVYTAGGSGNAQGIVRNGYTAKGTSIATSLGTTGNEITCADSSAIEAQVLMYGQYLDENNAGDDRFVVLP